MRGEAVVVAVAVLTAHRFDLPWPSFLLSVRQPPRSLPGSPAWRFNEGAQVAAYLARKLSGASLNDVAQILGNRAKPTVCNAASRVEEWCAVDRRIADICRSIEDEITRLSHRFECGEERFSIDPCVFQKESIARACEAALIGSADGLACPPGAKETRLEICITDADRLALPPVRPSESRWVYVTADRALWVEDDGSWRNLSAHGGH